MGSTKGTTKYHNRFTPRPRICTISNSREAIITSKALTKARLMEVMCPQPLGSLKLFQSQSLASPTRDGSRPRNFIGGCLEATKATRLQVRGEEARHRNRLQAYSL